MRSAPSTPSPMRLPRRSGAVVGLLLLGLAGCSRSHGLPPIAVAHEWALEETGRFHAGSEPILDLAFVPPSGSVACLGWRSPDGGFWEPGAGDRVTPVSLEGAPLRAMAVSPDGRLAAFGGDFSTISLWSTLERSETEQIPCSTSVGAVESLSFDPGGTLLAVTRSTGRVEVVNAASGRRLVVSDKTWKYPPRTLFLPGSRHLLVYGTPEGDPELVDVDSGRVSARLRGHRGGVSSALVTPDGRALVTAGDDRTLRIWQLPSLHPSGGFGGLPSTILTLAMRPAGDLLSAGDALGNLFLFDLKSHREVARGKVAGDRAWSVAWDGSGAALASGTDHGLVQLWSVALAGR